MPNVWPTLDAPSPNNFRDHFAGASLDATKWGSVVSGTGAVTVTDSYVECNAPVNSAAFIYYKTKLDKTKSQLWRIAMSRQTGTTGSAQMWLVNGASAPTADNNTNIDAKTLLARAWSNQSSLAVLDSYVSSAAATTFWGGNIPAWTTTYAAALNTSMPIRNDDYYILGLEFDGPNSRFRVMAWGKTYVAGYTFDQGWRLFGLSDWVNWSAVRSNADVWLCVGQLYNNDPDAKVYRTEWVDYCEQRGTTLFEGWTAACNASTGVFHSIRKVYSFDNRTYLPIDRATNELAPTGAGWESNDLQAPNVIRDGAGTDWMIYWGSNSVNTDGIGIAKATSTGTNPQNGPWTRGASNPILSPVAGETRVRYPYLFMDNMEADASKRWKIIAGVVRTSDSLGVYKLWTSPGPPDTGVWTARGIIIDKGGVGSKDESGVLDGGVVSVFYANGQYDVWYTGLDVSGVYHLLHASGTSLTALVKDTNDYFPPLATGTATLTANLTGRTLTVDSTAGFVQDGSIIFDQDANLDNWSMSKVRKVLSGTQLELYHGLDGFTTVTPAKVRQLDASINRGGQQMVRQALPGGGYEWRGLHTIWEPMNNLGANYLGLCEQNCLISHANASLTGANFALDQFYSPVTSRGFNLDLRSVENMGILLGPLQVDSGAARPTARMRGSRR